jgi:hypothetical protein
MKKLLAVLIMILSLLFVAPVYAQMSQVDVTPEVISAKCGQDGCIMIWKATLLNETKSPVEGNIIVLLQDKDKKTIVTFNIGLVSLEGSQAKEVGGVILLEKSERTKSIVYLTVFMKSIGQTKPVPKVTI